MHFLIKLNYATIRFESEFHKINFSRNPTHIEECQVFLPDFSTNIVHCIDNTDPYLNIH